MSDERVRRSPGSGKMAAEHNRTPHRAYPEHPPTYPEPPSTYPENLAPKRIVPDLLDKSLMLARFMPEEKLTENYLAAYYGRPENQLPWQRF